MINTSLIWMSVGLWLFIAAGAMWNNIFRRYATGVYAWLRHDVHVKLKANADWQKEARDLQDTIMPIINARVNESLWFVLILMIVLGVNSIALLTSLTGNVSDVLILFLAGSNAICVVGFFTLRKRHLELIAIVGSYMMLLVSMAIYENMESQHPETIQGE